MKKYYVIFKDNNFWLEPILKKGFGHCLIIIKDGSLYTTEEIWMGRDFSQRQIRHQASLLLRILHGAELASYNRKAVLRKKFTPYHWR